MFVISLKRLTTRFFTPAIYLSSLLAPRSERLRVLLTTARYSIGQYGYCRLRLRAALLNFLPKKRTLFR